MGTKKIGTGVATVLAVISPWLHAAASAAPPSVPMEASEVLAAHVGKWKTEGTFVVGGVSQPAKATWECTSAVGGVGLVCTWQHEWADRHTDQAIEVVGYDPLSNRLTWARVTDQGTIRVVPNEIRGNTLYYRWESTQDGKPLVGVNEVFIKPGQDVWTQRMTIDVDGKRTTEMNVTHQRVK
jgi:hypothetical protein